MRASGELLAIVELRRLFPGAFDDGYAPGASGSLGWPVEPLLLCLPPRWKILPASGPLRQAHVTLLGPGEECQIGE